MPQYELPSASDLPAKRPGKLGRRRIVVVLNHKSPSLEYMGPLQIFDETGFFFQSSGRTDLGYDLEFVTTEPGPIYSRKGLSITADTPYHRLRGPVDTLIFQAADEFDEMLSDKRFIDWVRKMSGKVRRIASICTGAFILGQAGVLDGRRATTHWCAANDFRRRYPKVKLETDPIYVKDGHVYTSAGASSGMDLTIALVEEDFGPDLARRVAQGMVMYMRRPGNQAQFCVQLAPHLSEESRIQGVREYVAENLTGDLRVETLAEQANMSPRNFTRVFTDQVGMTPGRFVEQYRLELARQVLEESDMPMTRLATRCGYDTPDGLRRAFERQLGVSPREYRQRFATSRIA